MINWLTNEWNQSSTHIWLAGLGATITAFANGQMTGKQALAAAVVSLLAIIIPQGPKT